MYWQISHWGDHHSFSGGLTYHVNTSFTCTSTDTSITGCNKVYDFDNALGAIAEYTYSVSDSREGGIRIGIHATSIRYDLNDGTQSFDGSSLGIIFYAH